ncbi:MAG: NADH-quinone oxidoreductase subunit M [Puniceicoccales bacterium]|jgi:NADH-quinone oxidoreductase subunit M|nr:NADH-quinone oxidoreductase subunit M [Puniceicoccales bacterium]
MNLLPWTIYLTFAGALVAWLVGNRSPAAARWTALVTALTGAGITLAAAFQFQPGNALQTLVKVPWARRLADYHLAVDGISMTLVVLTGIAAIAGILFSWNITHRTGDFFALFLALIGGVYGVFMSADAFLLFVFYEIAIVPKYFLVAVWGSTNREYGAMKLVLYSFAGSALVMAGLLWAKSLGVPFDMALFVEAARKLSTAQQTGLFALIFTGFAVLAGMFPFHTWAPTGHVAAPTGASMLLAGVVMKLGAYGCLRVALPAFPAGFETFQPVIAALAIIGIIYAGLIALVQTDFKFVIGYSSVSHMGFVLLGLAAATTTALSGAVLQMFSHGVVAGLLFAVVGRMVYERTHTRDLTHLREMPLHKLLPFAAVVFVFAGLASMGMPGFSGFPAELSILIGVWQHSPVWAVLAALGIPVAAAFTLRAVVLAFFGKGKGTDCEARGRGEAGQASHHPLPPITLPEKLGAGLLLAVSVLIGLRPDLLLDWIIPALNSPLMKIATQGGAQ